MSGELFGVAMFCITAAALSLMLRQYRHVLKTGVEGPKSGNSHDAGTEIVK